MLCRCFYLEFGKSYAQEISPKSQERGSPLKIYLNVSILAFPSIETVGLKFTADFYLNLRWYDSRLNYRDLNVAHSLNSLSTESMLDIWVPQLAFTNSLGPYQTVVDELTVGLLIREDDPLPEDITKDKEGTILMIQKWPASN
jgi:hypothetical protein